MADLKEQTTPPFDTKAATRAVIAVSQGGRGFVVEGRFPNPLTSKPKGRRGPFRPSPFRTSRYIITAAHCLPHVPPPDRVAYDRGFDVSEVDRAARQGALDLGGMPICRSCGGPSGARAARRTFGMGQRH